METYKFYFRFKGRLEVAYRRAETLTQAFEQLIAQYPDAAYVQHSVVRR